MREKSSVSLDCDMEDSGIQRKLPCSRKKSMSNPAQLSPLSSEEIPIYSFVQQNFSKPLYEKARSFKGWQVGIFSRTKRKHAGVPIDDGY